MFARTPVATRLTLGGEFVCAVLVATIFCGWALSASGTKHIVGPWVVTVALGGVASAACFFEDLWIAGPVLTSRFGYKSAFG